jgi:threonine aldolase
MSGLATLAGVMPRTVATGDGLLTAEAIRRAIRPRSAYAAELGLVVLENTQNLAGGLVQNAASVRAAVGEARAHGLKVHIDGARVWNAAVALGVAPRELLAGADTAMVSLAKGLGAPVGALLVSSSDLVARGRRVRKRLGGGMRQAGILAAAGLVALETMVDRLAEDHANARLLGDALSQVPGASVKPVETNIVISVLDGRSAPDAVRALRERDVLGLAMDARTLRLTTHKDVSRDDCERAAGLLRQALG